MKRIKCFTCDGIGLLPICSDESEGGGCKDGCHSNYFCKPCSRKNFNTETVDDKQFEKIWDLWLDIIFKEEERKRLYPDECGLTNELFKE